MLLKIGYSSWLGLEFRYTKVNDTLGAFLFMPNLVFDRFIRIKSRFSFLHFCGRYQFDCCWMKPACCLLGLLSHLAITVPRFPPWLCGIRDLLSLQSCSVSLPSLLPSLHCLCSEVNCRRGPGSQGILKQGRDIFFQRQGAHMGI